MRGPARVAAGAGATIGAVGFTAALVAAASAMNKIMVEAGGSCASGGPYEISQPCPEGTVALLTGGIIGGLVFAALLVGCSAALGGSALGLSLLLWGATFGALGWNFMRLGVFDPAGGEIDWGWAISGGLFWAMALGGLIPAAVMLAGRIRRGSAPPEPVFTQGPLVRAAVLPPDQQLRH
jgi:hypothetical protein